jgi:hypothetical protein
VDKAMQIIAGILRGLDFRGELESDLGTIGEIKIGKHRGGNCGYTGPDCPYQNDFSVTCDGLYIGKIVKKCEHSLASEIEFLFYRGCRMLDTDQKCPFVENDDVVCNTRSRVNPNYKNRKQCEHARLSREVL